MPLYNADRVTAAWRLEIHPTRNFTDAGVGVGRDVLCLLVVEADWRLTQVREWPRPKELASPALPASLVYAIVSTIAHHRSTRSAASFFGS